jgi:hypothetical protein
MDRLIRCAAAAGCRAPPFPSKHRQHGLQGMFPPALWAGVAFHPEALNREWLPGRSDMT